MYILPSLAIGLASIASVVLAALSTDSHHVFKRDVSTILIDLADLSTVVSWNLGNITAYRGGLDFNVLIPLVAASNLVDAALNKTTLDIQAHETFSIEDSSNVLQRTTTLVALLSDTLNALYTKQPLFRASNIHGIVLNSIVAHSAEEDLMYAQLILKAPESDKGSFEALHGQLIDLYTTVVASYSAA